MHKLTITIITLNEEDNIRRCITSVGDIASEIIVVDSFSTDSTPVICRELGCTVIQKEFTGYGKQKQFAVDSATNDWILSLDADEEISETLRNSISKLLSKEEILFSGYKIHRRLFYLGRVMKHSGLGKEKILRLFNRREGHFTDAPVHEEIVIGGPAGFLEGDFFHHSYKNLEHQIQKTNRYTTFAAVENIRKGKHYPKIWAVFKFPVTFFTVYILKGGILDGYPGFYWAYLAAHYASLKIAKTIELQRR